MTSFYNYLSSRGFAYCDEYLNRISGTLVGSALAVWNHSVCTTAVSRDCDINKRLLASATQQHVKLIFHRFFQRDFPTLDRRIPASLGYTSWKIDFTTMVNQIKSLDVIPCNGPGHSIADTGGTKLVTSLVEQNSNIIGTIANLYNFLCDRNEIPCDASWIKNGLAFCIFDITYFKSVTIQKISLRISGN
jgi:hypothetical protein